MEKAICIIPARSGSKRVKNKNIKLFNGKPIISYAIRFAKSTGLFKKIVVSTDSYKISKIAKRYGAEVPFIRSRKLSNDFAPTKDVVLDCIKRISSENTKYHFILYPTSILLLKKDFNNSFNKLKKYNYDFLVAVTDYAYSPHRAFKFIGKKKISFQSKRFINYRSQDLPRLVHDTGSFYIWKTKALLKHKGKMPKKSTYHLLDRYRSVDINTEQDFKLASLLYKFLKDH
tara:strand:+ start:410 stop:1099 length:690 start_codon:yes stop_codon:yes gene_type:complete